MPDVGGSWVNQGEAKPARKMKVKAAEPQSLSGAPNAVPAFAALTAWSRSPQVPILAVGVPYHTFSSLLILGWRRKRSSSSWAQEKQVFAPRESSCCRPLERAAYRSVDANLIWSKRLTFQANNSKWMYFFLLFLKVAWLFGKEKQLHKKEKYNVFSLPNISSPHPLLH